mgnify:FL=1
MKSNYIITGATSGIGKSVTFRLDFTGNHLILLARSSDNLKKISNLLKFATFDLVSADLLDLSFVDKLKELNVINIKGFVHCAGSESILPLRLISYDKFDKLMRLHVYSFVEIVKFIDKIKTQKSSYLTSIVGISSIASHDGGIGQTIYSASKAALESVCKVLSKELVKKKIRLNTILPGLVDTEMTERWRKKIGIQNKDDLHKMQLNGLIDPKEVAELINYLLSDLSKQIVGTEIRLDGGGPTDKIF